MNELSALRISNMEPGSVAPLSPMGKFPEIVIRTAGQENPNSAFVPYLCWI
jgi:hypothetical protein